MGVLNFGKGGGDGDGGVFNFGKGGEEGDGRSQSFNTAVTAADVSTVPIS